MLILITAEDVAKWAQIGAWVAAIIVAVFSVTKIVYELKQSRIQREEELKWKKAAAAKELIDEVFDSPKAKAAMKMLDWDGSVFLISDGVSESIKHKEMLYALRAENTDFSSKEEFIRDAFDGLFYYLGLFEHYVARDLVKFEDVNHPIDYYVELMARNRQVFSDFQRTYRFYRTEKFMERFDEWNRAKEFPARTPAKELPKEAAQIKTEE